mmetsp:Transcript_9558/g.21945  ORF Transcript_9558/g.21945 Transcript_9558/m.21945 type:complete len:242 (-) Transcript_9558:175-900(-)
MGHGASLPLASLRNPRTCSLPLVPMFTSDGSILSVVDPLMPLCLPARCWAFCLSWDGCFSSCSPSSSGSITWDGSVPTVWKNWSVWISPITAVPVWAVMMSNWNTSKPSTEEKETSHYPVLSIRETMDFHRKCLITEPNRAAVVDSWETVIVAVDIPDLVTIVDFQKMVALRGIVAAEADQVVAVVVDMDLETMYHNANHHHHCPTRVSVPILKTKRKWKPCRNSSNSVSVRACRDNANTS